MMHYILRLRKRQYKYVYECSDLDQIYKAAENTLQHETESRPLATEEALAVLAKNGHNDEGIEIIRMDPEVFMGNKTQQFERIGIYCTVSIPNARVSVLCTKLMQHAFFFSVIHPNWETSRSADALVERAQEQVI